MKFNGKTLKHLVCVGAATVGISLLALPAGISHAAVFPSAPSIGSFEVQITQGPDSGTYLNGLLSLTQISPTELQGSLTIKPLVSVAEVVKGEQITQVSQQIPMHTAPVIQVRGSVSLQSNVILLGFYAGYGRTIQAQLSSATTANAQWHAQTRGPQQGDVATISLHIALQYQGRLLNIVIEPTTVILI